MHVWIELRQGRNKRSNAILVFGVKKKKKVGLEISAQQEEQHFVKKS